MTTLTLASNTPIDVTNQLVVKAGSFDYDALNIITNNAQEAVWADIPNTGRIKIMGAGTATAFNAAWTDADAIAALKARIPGLA